MLYRAFSPLLLSILAAASSIHFNRQSNPTVVLSYGTFQGTSTQGIDSYLGIPFAQAERFGLPQPPNNLTGVQLAQAFGPECLQPNIVFPNGAAMSEDCLFVNVIKPSTEPNTKLPVLFWIYGGGFEIGDTSTNNGSTVVARSMDLGEPIIYVSANYRLNAFGFLGGEKVKAAGVGNLGLRDQRFAMQWVQDNIALFGGDPSRVTIWGQSAGAVSVGLHLIVNSGNPGGLFHGAFMESGIPFPLADISAGQQYYDQLVASTNCASSHDTLACMKTVPSNSLLNAVQDIPNYASFQSLNLAWRPYVDGVLFTESPMVSISQGAYARVPLVAGNVDDEGTLFSLSSLNLTTDDEAADYLHSNYLPTATDAQFQTVSDLYPSDPTQGSPFDTGLACQLSPEYKRIAAFTGDYLLQAPRRALLQVASTTQDTWSFLYKRGKNASCLGVEHGSDVPEFYGGPGADFQGTDALVNFVNTLDPNTGAVNGGLSTLIPWPKYSTDADAPPMLTFLDPGVLAVTNDTYRAAGMQAFAALFSCYV
ncbi:carotenoid ester lipase precursor [Gautieria morchelliformis]|nr:carotenoid ester lipase precursor [Gautieria morchelliformis]